MLATRSVSSLSVPAAVSTSGVRRDLRFSSFSERGAMGCRISGTFPICSLGASVTNGYGFYTKGGTRCATIMLRPADGTYSLSPLLYRLCSCFTRYRVSQLGFRYDPIGSTASAVRLAFCYSADPQSPLIYAISSYSGFNTLLSSVYGRTFSPWAGWSMRVTAPDSWLYLDPSASDTIAANIRQESFGIIACVADSDPGVDYSYGVLSMDLSLDLIDPVPIGATTLALASVADHKESLDSVRASIESSYVPVTSNSSAGMPASSQVSNSYFNTSSRVGTAPSLSGAPRQ